MGFFDKLKQGVKVLTGGAAKVSIQWEPTVVAPGQVIAVKISIQSTGAEVNSKGVFVDFYGAETVLVPPEPKEASAAPGTATGGVPPGAQAPAPSPVTSPQSQETDPAEPETESNHICCEVYALCGPFTLGANESKVVEGSVKIPDALPASSQEELGCHYRIRGRLEAFGNDPDSGYKDIWIVSVEAPEF